MAAILHASDYHLGLQFHQFPMSYREELKQYQKQCFISFIDYALEHRVDAILFAGDFFDTSTPSRDLVDFVELQLARLEQAGIPLILALGNHDVHLDRRALKSPTLKILSSEKVEKIVFPSWTVYGLSHEKVWDIRRPFQFMTETKEGYSLGLFHSVVGGEGEERYLPMDLGEIDTMNFDYLALGHVHEPRQLSTHSMAYYSGALCGTLQRQGGFYHYAFHEKSPRWIPSPAFPVKELHYKLHDLQRDLLEIDQRSKEELLYVVLEGELDAKEKLMLEHWKKGRGILLEDHTRSKLEGDLPKLLESCRELLQGDLSQLLQEEYLGWSREKIKGYFGERREELFEELLALYQGETYD